MSTKFADLQDDSSLMANKYRKNCIMLTWVSKWMLQHRIWALLILVTI